MSITKCLGVVAVFLVAVAPPVEGRINTVVVRNSNETASSDFNLRYLPAPSAEDAATDATITIVDGTRDRNGGTVSVLQNGRVPTQPDQPAENFFFAAGTPGGRLLFDLNRPLEVDQVNTYSWHPSTRGPQVYRLYGSAGSGDDFDREPERGVDPEEVGWQLIADVDTRDVADGDEMGGQHGVSIFAADGAMGTYRYLLFDITQTGDDSPFGNTFYSEIDVVASEPAVGIAADTERGVLHFETPGGAYRFTIDTTESPELTDWAEKELAPVVEAWYPKIVEMLPSENYQAPRTFSITFSPEFRGVAAASGNRIRGNPNWFQQQLDGEAKGAIVHELVHVVQQYGRGRRSNPDYRSAPGWLVEGIADYIRWFLYEPESRGAEISERNIANARYDASYRVSANFLNWIAENHDSEMIARLNAVLREGRYDDALWEEQLGLPLEDLGQDWKANLQDGGQ